MKPVGGVLMLVTAFLLSAVGALAQDGMEGRVNSVLRFDAGFYLGVLGRVNGEVPASFGTDRALSPSPGIYFRADVAFGRYFLFRPSVHWRSVKARGVGGPLHQYSVQVGLGVHHEFDFRRGESVTLDPYFFVMVGVDAVDRALVAVPVVDEGTSFGPSWSVRAGLITWLSPRFGVNVGGGFERADFFPSTLRDGHQHVYLMRLALELGVSFRFD